uniref:Uncharacterized protein n=1 Tax=Arundo donax TaxID=35708 RepID=A0A0A9BE37_ARUDO
MEELQIRLVLTIRRG